MAIGEFLRAMADKSPVQGAPEQMSGRCSSPSKPALGRRGCPTDPCLPTRSTSRADLQDFSGPACDPTIQSARMACHNSRMIWIDTTSSSRHEPDILPGPDQAGPDILDRNFGEVASAHSFAIGHPVGPVRT